MFSKGQRGALYLAFLLILPSEAWAQGPPVTGGGNSGSGSFGPAAMSKVLVRVRGEGGAPLLVFAVVRIYSNFGAYQQTAGTREASQVEFGNVPIGEYQIEVSAPGYEIAKQEASILTPDSSTYVYVDLRPEGQPGAVAAPSGPPVLAPKAQKELEAAYLALRAGDLKNAQQRLDKALKLAPGHPDVHYLRAILYLQQKNNAKARESLERAVQLYPDHFGAQSALGTLLYEQLENKGAITALEKAVQLQPLSWQSHRVLALCYFREQLFEKARAHTERALEISGNKAPELRLLLARVLMAARQFEQAQREIAAFILGNPSHPEIPEAKRLQTELKRETDVAQSSPAPQAAATPAAAIRSSADLRSGPPASPAKTSAANLAGPLPVIEPAMPESARLGPRSWAPPAVDDTLPFLLRNTSCRLPEVLSGAGKRATALAANLEQVTATENIEEADLGEDGSLRNIRTNVFNYLVNIVEVRKGNLSVEEDRIPVSRSAVSPRQKSTGLGALALIFHPYYAKDFEMRCEGLTEVKGQPAWSVYFKQRADLPSRIRTYTIQGARYNIALKGRAWIAANNFQVLRLETDLVEPVKGLRLEQERLVIEYQPVDFKSRKIRLWLPANAQMYSFLRGNRLLHRHIFTDYKVFSVDTSQKISEDVKH